MDITIHNQYSGMKLISPVCLCNRGKRHECRVEKTDTGTVMKFDLKFDFDQDELGGFLMYEIRRKRNARSNHRSNKIIEEALKMMRLLVTWKIDHSGKPNVNTALVEYDNKFVLSEDKTIQLYDKLKDILTSFSHGTWLICDSIALKVACSLKASQLKVTIFEGLRNSSTIKPIWIVSERQVSFLMAYTLC
jgi:hypothetical protein